MAKIYTRNKSPYWWARFSLPNGEEIRKSTKVPNKEELRKQAEIKANDWEVSEWKKWRPGSEIEQEYLFEELVEHYVTERKPGSAALGNLIRLNEFFFGQVMNNLSANEIRNYKEYRSNTIFRGKPISDATIRRELSTLSAMINYSKKEWDWKLDNPVTGRKPPASKGVIRWISQTEARHLITTARLDNTYSCTTDFVELAFNTGLRKMELLGLELNRIDLDHSVIHLYPEHQKNAQYSTVPLNDDSIAVIKKRLEWLKDTFPDSRWLFPSSRSKGENHITDPRKGFNTICERANIENFRIHDLRHTFASWLVQEGVPIYEVKELLRHKSISTTEKYAHLAPTETAKHVDLIQIMGGLHTIRTLDEDKMRQPQLVVSN